MPIRRTTTKIYSYFLKKLTWSESFFPWLQISFFFWTTKVKNISSQGSSYPWFVLTWLMLFLLLLLLLLSLFEFEFDDEGSSWIVNVSSCDASSSILRRFSTVFAKRKEKNKFWKVSAKKSIFLRKTLTKKWISKFWWIILNLV